MGIKKNIKRWAKKFDASTYNNTQIKANSEVVNIEKANQKAKEFVLKNKSDLFKISTKPDQNIIKTENKKLMPTLSKMEEKKILKIKKNISSNNVTNNNIELLEDVWGDNSCIQKENAIKNKEAVNPAIIIPQSGESYNPSQDKYNEMLKKIVEEDSIAKKEKVTINSEEDRKNKKIKKIQKLLKTTKNNKPSSKMTPKELQKHKEENITKEKKFRTNQLKNFEQIKNTILNQKKRMERKAREKEEIKVNFENKIKTGLLPRKKLKISKHVIPTLSSSNIKLPSELPKKLNEVQGNVADIARLRFTNIYQRGKIEYKPIGKSQKAKKYKIHNKRSIKEDPLMQ